MGMDGRDPAEALTCLVAAAACFRRRLQRPASRRTTEGLRRPRSPPTAQPRTPLSAPATIRSRRRSTREFLPLAYFPIDPDYNVPAALKPIDDPTIIEMPTSTGTKRKMRRVGTLEFTLKGQPLTLTAFIESATIRAVCSCRSAI